MPGQAGWQTAGRRKEFGMPDETRHESSDLTDYEVQDPADSLDPDQGVDPFDRGVVPPQHWSAGMKLATQGREQDESLDQALAEEEPDVTFDPEDEPPEDPAEGDDAADEYVDGLLLDDGPDPRAGRLVAEDEGAHSVAEADLVAMDAGIDGGAATAEEAAVHVVDDDDTDVRSDDDYDPFADE
jgi:hypothetical protein